MEFKLQFSPHLMNELSGRYQYPNEPEIVAIGKLARQRGHYTRDEFLRTARWKSPRNQPRHELNDERFIELVTGIALSTSHERLRIEVLTLLDGVKWPTASAFLHLAHPDPYPILDFRALWSLNVEVPPNTDGFYCLDLWLAYTKFCRDFANDRGISMRVLDRALWQYSKENQKETPPKCEPSF